LLLSCGKDNKIILWDLTKADGKPLKKMSGHKAAITDCNMSPGSDMIASIDVEGNIIITKIADGSQNKMKTEGKIVAVDWKD